MTKINFVILFVALISVIMVNGQSDQNTIKGVSIAEDTLPSQNPKRTEIKAYQIRDCVVY